MPGTHTPVPTAVSLSPRVNHWPCHSPSQLAAPPVQRVCAAAAAENGTKAAPGGGLLDADFGRVATAFGVACLHACSSSTLSSQQLLIEADQAEPVVLYVDSCI